jgi:hypothetical protein
MSTSPPPEIIVSTITPATSPLPAAAVTPEHISALHRRLDEIGAAIEHGFKQVLAYVKKEAPVVEAGAAAVAAAIPGAASIAAAVEKVAGAAADIVACICDCNAAHTPKGCSAPGCACKAPNTLSRPAS